MRNFKRILFFTNPSRKQIETLNLDIYTDNCYTCISLEENVKKNLEKAQAAGIHCHILVVDEHQFAAGNGIITRDVIVHEATREGGAQ